MSIYKKNTATTLSFCLVSTTDGSAVTTGTTTCYYTLDGGTQQTGNTATHEGNGQWTVAIAAAHINGDSCGYLMVNSSAVLVNLQLHTDTKLVSELNDVAATDIVSAGAITTSSGAVSTVSTVSNGVTVTTNNDKTGYSISGTLTTLDALNNFNPTTDTVTNVTNVATTTSVTNAVVLPTIPANWITAAGINAAALNGKGDWNIGKTGYSVDTVNDKTGYSLTQAFPTNFADLAITVTTGLVSVGTNNDKAGYSISGAITTLDGLNNFDPTTDTVATVTTLTNLPAITAGWLTAAGIAASALNGKGDWNIGKTGYSLTQTFPTNFADLAITASTGLVSVGTNNDKTGYTASTVSDKTGYSISGTITTLDGLNDLSAAEVNAEMVDTLVTDTYAEPGQGAPAATASLKDKIGYLYKMLRNKKIANATLVEVYNDAGDTVDQKRTVSDDGVDYTEEEIVSGP